MKKYLANIFICDRNRTKEDWDFKTDKFKSLGIEWYNNPTYGHPTGFACQGIFDTDDKNEAMKITNMIETSIGGVTMVLYLIDIEQITFPIGKCNDKQLVSPGRQFDKMVKNGETGVYFIDNLSESIHIKRFSEMVKVDVEVGDFIYMGKFKNKKTLVKTIDKDEYGN